MGCDCSGNTLQIATTEFTAMWTLHCRCDYIWCMWPSSRVDYRRYENTLELNGRKLTQFSRTRHKLLFTVAIVQIIFISSPRMAVMRRTRYVFAACTVYYIHKIHICIILAQVYHSPLLFISFHQSKINLIIKLSKYPVVRIRYGNFCSIKGIAQNYRANGPRFRTLIKV